MKNKKWFYNILLLVFALVFAVSGGMLVYKIYQDKQQEGVFTDLQNVFTGESLSAADGFDLTEASSPAEPETTQDQPAGEAMTPFQQARAQWQERVGGYVQLHEQNNDFIGWVSIDQTAIDYPVMYTPDRKDYYLKRNFDRQNSAYGVPYISELCVLGEEGTNLLLYGHHMKNGSMFAALDGYRDAAFYQEHPLVRFDTLEEAGLYEVVGSWLIPNVGVQNQQVEQLFRLLFAQSEEEFEQDWKAVQKNFFVDTGISVSYEDKLLALVTCDYSYNDSRIVVIARRLEE